LKVRANIIQDDRFGKLTHSHLQQFHYGYIYIAIDVRPISLRRQQ